ncbi:flagellin N-terminal helical domain-containing protein [Bacillus sp. M6-12]|uniref:flagellin N-terminal helical domain-containing protein n=1 Tax=Bacillus sp. M6-12 TaxID=2054166 RepID=UPI0026C75C32
MKINHNIQALNAYRNLYQNQFNSSKNLERLSSGLRINRAADDAAGLAISEKMRSQIRGLKQAERNSLDGVSLMQVAEGAMTEVHSMLQRMRELAVQAANDTNTTSDRNSIQLEIDQLLKEIDSIAAKTEFNTRKLLDGSSAVDTQYRVGQMQNTNIKSVPVVTDPSIATGTYQIGVENTPSLVYTLNQPGAGVSSEGVITIETETKLATNGANISGVSITDPNLKTSDATYEYSITGKTNIDTVNDATGGFTNKTITPAAGITSLGYGDGLEIGDYSIKITDYQIGTSGSASTADIEIIDPSGNSIGVLADRALSGSVTLGTSPETITLTALNTINVSGTVKVTVAPQSIDFAIGKDLPPGEYSINVSAYNGSTATIQVNGPDGQPVHPALTDVTIPGSPITIGSGNTQITINAPALNGNGTAKIKVETQADIVVNKLKADGTRELYASQSDVTFASGSSQTVSLNGFDITLNPTAMANGASNFNIKTSDLGLGEFAIVVSDYQKDSNQVESATIEIFDPNGFSIGKLAAQIGENHGSLQTIGTDSGKRVQINTKLITQAGTAKVQIEGKMKVAVSKVNDDNTATAITFSKELTTRNGKMAHGGLEMVFGANAKEGTSNFDLTNKALSFQIGANTNQNVNIDVPELSTVKLGIDEINVLSHKEANDAIFKLEQAINQISATRSKLGATQNRLEHTISNLLTTNENLTASESRIRDADMASEMTEFTKNNILNQSAQAMLAQANQLPQGILQLLQR